MSVEFCHITPTAHLNLVDGRSVHLLLAHLIEQNQDYVNFYIEQKQKYNCTLILDNSAFEMYKQKLPMYSPSKLVEMGNKVGADYIVLTDYPGQPAELTISSAETLAPEFKAAGFKTFFVPQSSVGNVKQLKEGFKWAANNPQLIDYIGVSILAVPLAYNVESGNKLQRFSSRLRFMYDMRDTTTFDLIKRNGQKIHFLGMVDGPNEIMFMNPFGKYIDTWDSSAAVWAGLNGIAFDETPTGLINGKFEHEVDFNFVTDDDQLISLAKANMSYIDRIAYGYIW